MRLSSAILLGIQISTVISLPTRAERSQLSTLSSAVLPRSINTLPLSGPAKREKEEKEATKEVAKKAAKNETAKVEAGKAANNTAGAGEAAAGEAEAGEAGEKILEGAFGAKVALEGGDIKQDTEFPPSAIGKFEFEFQSKNADELTVTENKTPAAPPAGFEAIEPSSFQVALGVSKGAGLTLSKIDYIFDPASTALAGKDLTQAKVGKLCTDTGSFVIEETLGELEFEAEENEVTLNLNKAVTSEGEWGIFLPVAAAAVAGGGAKVEAGKGANGTAETATPAAGGAADLTGTLTAIIDALRQGKQAVPAFAAPKI